MLLGLSTFGNDPTAVWDYLAPLLAYAQDIIPPSLHHETPLFLLATAGMRLLDPHQQQAVIEATCMFFRSNSNFRLESSLISLIPSQAAPGESRLPFWCGFLKVGPGRLEHGCINSLSLFAVFPPQHVGRIGLSESALQLCLL